MKLLQALPLVTLASAVAIRREESVSYDGYKVFRIATGDELASVREKIASFSAEPWNRDISQHLDIALAPNQLEEFEALGLNVTVMHEDLGADIAAESTTDGSYLEARQSGSVPSANWFNSYHTYNEHLQWLRDMQAAFPARAEIITAGTSVQGRALTGLRLRGSSGSPKPAVLFHGTVHAREWITTMTVEYLIYQLLTTYATDATTRSFLDSYDFYIMPIVNPDGFVYTQTDRLWRKNRSAAPSGSSCLGTDLNRNWPYQWAVPGGSSTNPCDQTYRGRAQGDQPEMRGMISQIQSLTGGQGIKLYIDWHSYGQYILTPYGYSCSAVASNQAQHDSLAAGTGNAIRAVGGTRWTTGPSCRTLYATSGSSTDYIGDVAGAEYSLTIELRDTGANGFVLPASQILPSGREQWAGMRYLLANI
jgi:carboxypeptidase A4